MNTDDLANEEKINRDVTALAEFLYDVYREKKRKDMIGDERI